MKAVHFIGTSRNDLRSFPEEVKHEAGFSIYLAQYGDKAINAVPLKGFGNARMLEIIINDRGNTYRVIYTVRFRTAVYVLHAFQKKSKKGSKTPKYETELIIQRLKVAEHHYEQTYTSKQSETAKGR
jgi:phage-related protein